jgi:Derlin-2/3
MVALDLIMGGPPAAAQAITGVIVGWGWYLMGGGQPQGGWRAVGKAPAWLRGLVPTGEVRIPGVQHVQPPPVRGAREAPRVGGHHWGTGNRLGS